MGGIGRRTKRLYKQQQAEKSIPVVTVVLLGLLALSIPGIIVELTIHGVAYDLHSDAGHDFRLIYSAAHTLWLHHNPYDPRVFSQQTIDDGMPPSRLFRGSTLVQPYVYPPIFAWLFAPLIALGMQQALFLWRVLSVSLVFFGSLLLIRAWASNRVPFFASMRDCIILSAVIAASPLSAYVIYWGNPVVLVYAAVCGWVYALQRHSVKWDIVAGALMGISLLKPQLALPLAIIAVVCFVRGEDMKHRCRSIFFGFGAFVAIFLVLDVLMVPPSLLVAWPRSVLYLSEKLSLQPDMPSLYGLLKYLVPAVGDMRVVPVGIAVIGGVTLVALYRQLSHIWHSTALFGLLTVVWCFVAPYAHGNDQLLFVPGAIALGVAIQTSFAQPLAPAKTRHHVQLLQSCVSLATVALALITLWIGPSLGLIRLWNHNLPVSVAVVVAPLSILVAFLTTEPLHRYEPNIYLSPLWLP